MMNEKQDADRELDIVIKEVSDLLRDIEKIKCDVLELKEYLIGQNVGCANLVVLE